MAVVYTKELFPNRRGSDNISRQRTYTRIFEVRTDDPNDDAFTAGAGTGIPRNGEEHPSDPFATMIDISAEQMEDDFTLWVVTCLYESSPPEDQQREALTYDANGDPAENPGASGNFEREDNPLLRPASWRTTHEKVMEVVYRGVTDFGWIVPGPAVVNSAGDPFDPPLMEERSYKVVTITKNVALDNPILSWDIQEDYQDSVNSDEYRGRRIGTLKIDAIDVESAIENRLSYAIVHVIVKFRPDGWKRSIIDAGYREIVLIDPDGGGPQEFPQHIRDQWGNLIGSPKLLDGSGQQLPFGEDPVFLTFQTKRSMPFATFFAYLGL